MIKHNRHAAEMATAWLIRNPGASYRTAAARFNVPVQALRARIMNRWCTLELAREFATLESERVSPGIKNCVSCGADRDRDDIVLCDFCASTAPADMSLPLFSWARSNQKRPKTRAMAKRARSALNRRAAA